MGDKRLGLEVLEVRWGGLNKKWCITIRRADYVLQRIEVRCGQTEAKEAGRVLLELWRIKEGGA